MDSELLTCLLKFIEYFPDYLSALSRTLLPFFWTTFVETAVCVHVLCWLMDKRLPRRLDQNVGNLEVSTVIEQVANHKHLGVMIDGDPAYEVYVVELHFFV